MITINNKIYHYVLELYEQDGLTVQELSQAIWACQWLHYSENGRYKKNL